MSLLHFAPLLFQAQEQVVEQVSGGINPIFTIAIFVGMLVVLVFVHELGHFLVALWMGIRVEEFGIGLPPRAVTLFRYKGVDYTLNWLPLGGFVRFVGDDNVYSGAQKPVDPDSEAARANTERGSDGRMLLHEAPPWRKIPVMLAGPAANVLAAIAIFAALFMFAGVPTPVGQEISEVFDNSPAAAAGFQADDIVISLAGTSVIESQDALKDIALDNEGQAIEAIIVRDGENATLTVTPGPWTDAEGNATVGLGIRYAPEVEYQLVNPIAAIGASFVTSGNVINGMMNGLGQMVGGLLGINEPPPGGVAGPVGIARATGEVVEAGGALAFWNWMALISLNLAIINLLPIPALDGSHIVFALIEWIRGRKVPPEKEAMVHAIGFATLMGLIVIVSIIDVRNAIQGIPVLPGG